jgi:TfoX/Sxy family transcriptional regulator of competence genes
MASTASLMQYVVDQVGPGATSRPMFGEYGVYFRGTIIGLFCDDRLFLKRTQAAAALLGPHDLDAPYPGARPAIVVPEESWDDAALMARLAAETATELGKAPVKKKARRKKASAGRKVGR